MSEYEVVIPEAFFSGIEFKQDELPGFAVVNSALKEFEPKVVFSWHLSVIIDCEDTDEKGMPTENEEAVLAPFEQKLNSLIQWSDSDRPNSLFLARITWNKTRELVWRVFEPAMANNILQDIVSKDTFTRSVDYKMENDPEWNRTRWHLR